LLSIPDIATLITLMLLPMADLYNTLSQNLHITKHLNVTLCELNLQSFNATIVFIGEWLNLALLVSR